MDGRFFSSFPADFFFFLGTSVIIATIFQLRYIDELFNSNFMFTSYKFIICTQVVQTTSIVTACIPHLQSFMASLQSGLITADDGGRHRPSKRSTSLLFTDTSTNRKGYRNIDERSVNVPLERINNTSEQNMIPVP